MVSYSNDFLPDEVQPDYLLLFPFLEMRANGITHLLVESDKVICLSEIGSPRARAANPTSGASSAMNISSVMIAPSAVATSAYPPTHHRA